jgi:guanylate kinase
VFVKPPSFEVNEQRLRARGTEDEAEIEKRLEVARAQLEQADQFDYLVVNDDLDRAVDELEDIVRGELSAAGTIPQP